MFFLTLFTLVEDMIKEVDVDGDGRIDFYGKYIDFCLFGMYMFSRRAQLSGNDFIINLTSITFYDRIQISYLMYSRYTEYGTS